LIYLDTSVVIAYYLTDAHSARAQEIHARDGDLFISELVELEVMSVISRLLRTGSITADEARRAADLFIGHADGGLYAKANLTAVHFRMARGYVGRFDAPLKAPDALHIAAAGEKGLRLMAADGQLVRNARAFGVEAELVEA
jgi:predicted nucleic acid-binding protein